MCSYGGARVSWVEEYTYALLVRCLTCWVNEDLLLVEALNLGDAATNEFKRVSGSTAAKV